MASEQGPTDEQQQGRLAYPLDSMLNELGDPQDPTKVSFPFLRLMRRDHMVSMGLHFIAMPIVSASWYYEADEARAAAFADNLIRPIYGRLVLTILRFLWSGYSPAAKNFEVIQPTWKYLPGPGKEPQKVWQSDSTGALVYKPVTPLRPENAKPKWTNGSFGGIKYDHRYGGSGYFKIDGDRRKDIDLLHSVWAVHDQDNEDGSPFGFPRIAHCAPIFHMYRYIWTLLGRAFENNADPGPVMRYPSMDAPIANPDGGPATPNPQTALKLGRRRRSGSTIALPSDTHMDYQDRPSSTYKWNIEYPRAETNFQEIMEFLDWLETLKLRALWLQEQGLVEGSGSTSNRNVASEFGDQRDASQMVLMQQIADFIDLIFLKPAFAMNMPDYEGSIKMKTMGFGQNDEDVVRQILQLTGQDDVGNFHVDVNRILEARGLPMLGPELVAELERQKREAAAQSAIGGPPAVMPAANGNGTTNGNGTVTQGRRALVTQTGFDRESGQPHMMYVQLEDPITLADDGDFVANLPRNDVFTDKQVIRAARSLRTDAKGFLTWLYGDFAMYLGKQKTLDLAAELIRAHSELLDEGENLADEKAVRRVVDKVLGGWRPKAERLAAFTTSSRGVLGRVFDRTAGIQLSRVRSNAKLSELDKTAANWLDERGAEMISSVLDTTRDQLAEVLADGVREGKRPQQIARDIREHFEGFPAARAATIARTEVSTAYNYATVRAGMSAGVKRAQLLDGNEDAPCKKRNGRIVNLVDALKEKLAHPNCTLTVRLLPRAAANLSEVEAQLDGLYARYDEPSATIMFDPSINDEHRTAWLLRLGDVLAEPLEDEIVEAELVPTV